MDDTRMFLHARLMGRDVFCSFLLPSLLLPLGAACGARVRPLPDEPCVSRPDVDRDGHVAADCDGDDCDDGDAAVHPGAPDGMTAGDWTTAQVDPDASLCVFGPGAHATVGLDESGRAQVVYTAGFGEVAHTAWQGGAFAVLWSGERRLGWEPVFAVGPAGDAHVVETAVAGLVHTLLGPGDSSTSEVVDRGGNASMAVDRSGTVHLVYCDLAEGELRHATNRDALWAPEAVPGTDCGWDTYTDVAVDARGAAHVVYASFPAKDTPTALEYATNVGGAWSLRRVEDSPDFRLPSMDVAADGALHVLYSSRSRGALYATNGGGELVSEAFLDGAIPSEAALAVGPDGVVGVVHGSAPGTEALAYSTRTPTGWSTVPLPIEGGRVSLAIDASGAAHVTAVGCGADGLVYATNRGRAGDGVDQDCDGVDGKDSDRDGHGSLATGGDDCDDGDLSVHPGARETAGDCVDRDCDGEGAPPDADGDRHVTPACGGDDCDDSDPAAHGGAPSEAWSIEAALGPGSFYFPSVAVDASGRLHVSYHDGGAQDLRYATNASGAWVSEVVDSDGDVGWDTSIALDEAGSVHVSYGGEPGLRHAWKAPDGWTVTDVEAGRMADTAIAIDASGAVHVAYRDWGSHDLRYAVLRDGIWSVEEVDASGDTGREPALAVESSGAVHVVHVDWSRSVLRYATRAAGGWTLGDVTPLWTDGSGVSLRPSIGIDSRGAVQVAFTDGDSCDLRVATGSDDSWSVETVDPDGGCGPAALVFDETGAAHVGYFGDPTREGLRHATDASGAWTVETVAPIGEGLAMAAGPEGALAIVLTGVDSSLRIATPRRPPGVVDLDCSGRDPIDADRDGSASRETGGADCDDADASVFPGAADPAGDLHDQDCDRVDG